MNKKTIEERFWSCKGIKYALFCCNEENADKVPIYVREQCKQLIDTLKHDDSIYIDFKKYKAIEKLLTLMRLPDDPTKKLSNVLDDYIHLLLICGFCVKLKKDDSRLYQRILLLISRKNRKTFCCALYMIISLIFDGNYQKYYSVAPTHALSKEVLNAVTKIVGVSPQLQKLFRCCRDYCKFKENNSEYIPLAYSGDSLDGRMAKTFVADEIGLLPNRYPINSMESSQITLTDKCGICISTRYPSVSDNVLDEEESLVKTILNENKSTEKRYFGLLFTPDEEFIPYWDKNGTKEQLSCIYQSNPVSLYADYLVQEILDKIDLCKMYPSRKENTLVKHLGIKFVSIGTEAYMTLDEINKAFENNENIDFRNKKIFAGFDLSEKLDNTSLTLSYMEGNCIYSKVVIFVAEDHIDEKSRKEKVNYRKLVEQGSAVIAGDDSIDYNVVEDYIVNFLLDNNCTIVALGYDRRSASMLVYNLENKHRIPCVDVPQHSSTLGLFIQEFKRLVLQNRYKFENFEYIKENFCNARISEDTNRRPYINKKKSNAKVDICFSTLNCMVVMEDLIKQGDMDYIDDIYY